jgi:pyrroline-5-carboxylate reductase
MLADKKVCFVGAGAMAEAVLAGMLNNRIIKPGAVSVTNRSDRFRLDELVYNFGVVADAELKDQSIRQADILILAMKPKDVGAALEDIRVYTHSNQLVISVIAGITTAFISQGLGHDAPVIRTMPNTSAAIGLSATGICRGKTATDEHVELTRYIFEAIGTVELVGEDQLDAITALAGSGPAYIYYLVEAMQEGASQVGLADETSKRLILQTLLGAVHMLQETGEAPSSLREKVTSPGGTTQAGLDVLRSYRFDEAVKSCIMRARDRSKELGHILSATNSK